MTAQQKERLNAHQENRQKALTEAHWFWLRGEHEKASRRERIAEHETAVCLAIAKDKQREKLADRLLRRANAPKTDFAEYLDRLYPDAVELPL
jgi:hypothetical protein